MADLQDMSIRSVSVESVMADHILAYATNPLAGWPSCNYFCMILFLRSVLCAETRSLVNTQQQALVMSACRQPFTCGNHQISTIIFASAYGTNTTLNNTRQCHHKRHPA